MWGLLLAQFASPFRCRFLYALPEPSYEASKQILVTIGLHFGSILASFSGIPVNTKTIKNCRENTVFQGPRGSRKVIFSNTLFKRPSRHPLAQLVGVLGRYWVHFGYTKSTENEQEKHCKISVFRTSLNPSIMWTGGGCTGY